MSNHRNLAVQFDGPAAFGAFLKRLEPQMALALPSFMKPARITRLAMTVFSSNPDLAQCSQRSIAAAILTACQLGLEPNVNGQGYLIPYKGVCTFVPGWKGLVDLANRSGRCTVWTGAVYKGDEFDYGLGDRPFVTHKPGDGDDSPENLTHVYAVGKIKGNDVPVIEVWPISKIKRHRDRFNKVGNKHYSYNNWEMYARKIPLLQVLKYMPQSIELTAAMEAAHAAENGANVVIDAESFVVATDPEASYSGDDEPTDEAPPPAKAGPRGGSDQPQGNGKPPIPESVFETEAPDWKALITKGRRTVAQVIAMAETRYTLSPDQKMEIASWAANTTPTTNEA